MTRDYHKLLQTAAKATEGYVRTDKLVKEADPRPDEYNVDSVDKIYGTTPSSLESSINIPKSLAALTLMTMGAGGLYYLAEKLRKDQEKKERLEYLNSENMMDDELGRRTTTINMSQVSDKQASFDKDAKLDFTAPWKMPALGSQGLDGKTPIYVRPEDFKDTWSRMGLKVDRLGAAKLPAAIAAGSILLPFSFAAGALLARGVDSVSSAVAGSDPGNVNSRLKRQVSKKYEEHRKLLAELRGVMNGEDEGLEKDAGLPEVGTAVARFFGRVGRSLGRGVQHPVRAIRHPRIHARATWSRPAGTGYEQAFYEGMHPNGAGIGSNTYRVRSRNAEGVFGTNVSGKGTLAETLEARILREGGTENEAILKKLIYTVKNNPSPENLDRLREFIGSPTTTKLLNEGFESIRLHPLRLPGERIGQFPAWYGKQWREHPYKTFFGTMGVRDTLVGLSGDEDDKKSFWYNLVHHPLRTPFKRLLLTSGSFDSRKLFYTAPFHWLIDAAETAGKNVQTYGGKVLNETVVQPITKAHREAQEYAREENLALHGKSKDGVSTGWGLNSDIAKGVVGFVALCALPFVTTGAIRGAKGLMKGVDEGYRSATEAPAVQAMQAWKSTLGNREMAIDTPQALLVSEEENKKKKKKRKSVSAEATDAKQE